MTAIYDFLFAAAHCLFRTAPARLCGSRDAAPSEAGAPPSHTQNRERRVATAEHTGSPQPDAQMHGVSESEERYLLALDGAGQGVWDWWIEQDRMHWTEGNTRLLGCPAAEAPADMSGWRARMDSDDLAEFDAALARHLEVGERFACRYRIRAAGDAWRWWETSGAAERDGQGRPHRMLGINRDVTDEVARANALAEAVAAATAASAAKSTFLAQMSHEIRTPMNGVIGMTDVLRESSLDDRQRSAVETILRSAEGLLAIVNDALDLAKVEAGELELAKAPFDLHATLEDVAALLGPVARRKGLTLILDLDQAMPPRVVGDETRLRQIVTNLLGNAVKFTQEGHVVLRLSQAEEPGAVVIQVQDTGPGIPPALRERIFTAFAQGPLRTAQEGGTGLGLVICQRLAGAMGGDVTLEPTEGTGATFTCTLRLDPAPEPELGAEPAGAAMAPAGRVALVVEHAEKRAVLACLLGQWGWNVTAHADLADLEAACEGEAIGSVAVLDAVAVAGEPLAALAHIVTLGPAALGLLADEDCEAVTTLREAGLDSLELPVCEEPIRPSALRAMLMALAESAVAAGDPAASGAGAVQRRRPCPPPARSTPVHAPKHPLRHPTAAVLVAEDNRINRLVIGRLLEQAVGRVIFAETGEEAVSLWQSHAPDLVLMDLQMPVLDGYGAARAIRAAEHETGRSRVPIVALTANVLEDDRGRCVAAGIDDFMDKPLRREALLQRLDHWLDDARETRAGHTAA
ncbi:MAG: ATP-binding protein [Pseudomonadota bacterium]